MPAGRPTDYKSDYAWMAKVACEEGGFTDKKLAKLFGCSTATIHAWKKEFPKFLSSIVKGKNEFDCMKGEKSLLKRAQGYKFTEKPVNALLILNTIQTIQIKNQNLSLSLLKPFPNTSPLRQKPLFISWTIAAWADGAMSNLLKYQVKKVDFLFYSKMLKIDRIYAPKVIRC